jgi:hypothetical protein
MHQEWNICVEMEVYLYALLISALQVGECSDSRPGHFNNGERASSIHWIGGWVGLNADLQAVEK